MYTKKTKWVWLLVGLSLLLVACGSEEVTPEVVELNEVVEATAVPPTEPPVEATEELDAESIAEATAVDPIIAAFNEPVQVGGDLVILSGVVMDVNGNPIEGAAVEIWQTDGNGVYDHPNDPGTNGRDRSFQFYGTSVTGADGIYSFRTLKPAAYGPRPPHIHLKVKHNGATLLTSQFYFEEDRAIVQGEGLFQQAGELGHLLLVILSEGLDANGNPIRLGTNNIVVDTGIGSGTETLTPAQGEGPYYPVVTVADFDNDLVALP